MRQTVSGRQQKRGKHYSAAQFTNQRDIITKAAHRLASIYEVGCDLLNKQEIKINGTLYTKVQQTQRDTHSSNVVPAVDARASDYKTSHYNTHKKGFNQIGYTVHLNIRVRG